MNQTEVRATVEVHRHTPSTPWTYALLDQRQREIAAAIRADAAPGRLLMSEVAPVITRGRRTAASDLLLAPEALERRGVSLYEVNRGGLGTYHGPGQWVLFAVDRLERLTGDRRGVRKAVEGLLEIALEVGRSLDPQVQIREGAELGVWSARGKFAAVGVQIDQGVLLHGLSFNAFRTPLSFMGLRPCGLAAPVDFLLDNAGKGPSDFEALGVQLQEATFRKFWNTLPL